MSTYFLELFVNMHFSNKYRKKIKGWGENNTLENIVEFG